jgi:FixJ family two-component response regulator
MALVSSRLMNKQIAAEMNLAEITVKAAYKSASVAVKPMYDFPFRLGGTFN